MSELCSIFEKKIVNFLQETSMGLARFNVNVLLPFINKLFFTARNGLKMKICLNRFSIRNVP